MNQFVKDENAIEVPRVAPVLTSRFKAPASTSEVLRGQRVAMVTFSSYPADPRPRRAAYALLEEGMSVDLICLADENQPMHESIGLIDVLRIPIQHRRGGILPYCYNYSAFIILVAAIVALRSLRRRYDVVYVHNMPDVLVLSALIPRVLGANVILDMHDPMPELMMTIFNANRQSRSVRLLKYLEKWSMRQADLVLTPNFATKRVFSSRSCNANKIDIVMNSPDEKMFPLCNPHARTSGGMQGGSSFIVMYHGSLVERNGLDLAVDALARVRMTNRFVELRVYGHATPFLRSVMETARKKNVDLSYRGPKRHEDLALEIEDCDVGIIPNHNNAFTEINTPTRIFEYLALGKPVIAPRTQGIEDYFSPGSLFFFEAGNGGDLAEKIEYVCSHPKESIETAARGQQIYLAHTWSRERERFVNLISKLLNHHKSIDREPESTSAKV